MNCGRVLLRVSVEALGEALGLPPNTSVERVWETDADKSMRTYTVCISGAELPISPEGWILPYVNIEELRQFVPPDGI